MTHPPTDTGALPVTQESRDEFLARMSDELLTPLNAVIGFARLLEKNRAGNQRLEDLDLLRRVLANGEQLLRLVTGVLEQSRLAAGELKLSLEPTDVAAIALRVADQYRGAAAAKGLRLSAIVPDSSPIVLDGERFEAIVRHIVENAVKFTPSGVVRVALAWDLDTRRPRRLTVSDSGIGIAPDRLGRIFIPFEQVETGANRGYRGMGLGLALAKSLSESMGCRLSVSSELGKGSRFTIHFPSDAQRAEPRR